MLLWRGMKHPQLSRNCNSCTTKELKMSQSSRARTEYPSISEFLLSTTDPTNCFTSTRHGSSHRGNVTQMLKEQKACQVQRFERLLKKMISIASDWDYHRG